MFDFYTHSIYLTPGKGNVGISVSIFPSNNSGIHQYVSEEVNLYITIEVFPYSAPIPSEFEIL